MRSLQSILRNAGCGLLALGVIASGRARQAKQKALAGGVISSAGPPEGTAVGDGEGPGVAVPVAGVSVPTGMGTIGLGLGKLGVPNATGAPEASYIRPFQRLTTSITAGLATC